MRPQQDFSRFFCSCCCPPLLSCSFLVPFRSSFTLSIHFFGCLPLLLVPSTCPYSATTGSLFPSILVTCPNHVSLLFLILSTNVTCCPMQLLSGNLVSYPFSSGPSQYFSQPAHFATSILLSSSFHRHQHSDPYINTRMTTVPYSFTFICCCYVVRPPHFVRCAKHCRGQSDSSLYVLRAAAVLRYHSS